MKTHTTFTPNSLSTQALRFLCLICLLFAPTIWADETANETTNTKADKTSNATNQNEALKIWQGDLLPKQFDKFAKGQYSQVDGNIYITNSDLTDLSALSKLTSVSGDLVIGQAPSNTDNRKLIAQLAGFSLLGSTENIEPLEIPLGGNPNLTSLKGLEHLEQVDSLEIEDNPKLKSIKALSALSSLRYLTIQNNRQLQSLDGLQTLAKNAKQAHTFYLRNNPKITSISQLYGVESLRDLVILDQPNLQSLAGLDKLKHISDRLLLEGNQQLKNLKGLGKLEHIGGSLRLIENSSLTQIEDLSALKTVADGFLQVENNRRLKSLSGLEQIKTIKEVYVEKNISLTSLNGLEGLTKVEGDVDIMDNPLLEDFTALNQLTQIGGRLEISDNSYTPVKGFNSLKSVKKMTIDTGVDKTAFAQLAQAEEIHVYMLKGPLVYSLDGVLPSIRSLKLLNIYGNTQLETLGDFLPNLERVEHLRVVENKSITNFDGLNALKFVKEIEIENNEGINKITGLNALENVEKMTVVKNLNLQSITGFNGLTQSSDHIVVKDNTDLLDLQGFNNMIQAKTFAVRDNEALQRISAFNALESIKGELWIDNNPKLNDLGEMSLQGEVQKLHIEDSPSLENLNAFKHLKTANKFYIKKTGITDLTGLEQLQRAENVYIEENPKLKSLKGLEQFKNVDHLAIKKNPQLNSLQGLNNLTNANTLIISNNPALTKLEGLEKLVYITELWIYENDSLNDYDGLSGVGLSHLKPNKFNVYSNKLNVSQTSLILSVAMMRQKIPEEFFMQTANLKQLYFLRNEVFARQGFVFGKDDLIEHFSRFGWYIPDENAEIKLSEITEENLKTIKTIEAKAHANIKNAIDILKNKQSEFINKDDAFFAPSVSRFAKTLSVKKLLSNNLAYTDNYLIQDDDCRDNLKIEFSDKVQSFNFTVKQCVRAEYDDETGDVTPLDSFKLCNMRMADAQQEEGVYTTAQCEVDTKDPPGAQYLVQIVSYNFKLEGDTFELARRHSYTTLPHYENPEEEEY